MTAYRAIPSTEVDAESPITEPLLVALVNNILAIIEGDGTAPRIDPINAMAHEGAYGAVGTYVMGLTSGSVVAGNTYAGSSISPSGVVVNTVAGVTWDEIVGTALSGTWRAMGAATASSNSSVTLFLRIL